MGLYFCQIPQYPLPAQLYHRLDELLDYSLNAALAYNQADGRRGPSSRLMRLLVSSLSLALRNLQHK